MSISRFVAPVFSVGLMVLNGGVVCAQDFPSKTIRIFASEPGGGSDFTARLIAQGISGPMGQPVVVENRPSILIGELVAKSPPDGYTAGITGAPMWVNPLLQKTSYDPVKDFAPITWLTATPHVLVVHPSLPVKSVKELIALAKARRGELNYSSVSPGSEATLGMELLKSMAGVNIVGVPYKGSGLALNAVLAGETQLMFSPAVAVASLIKSGKLRALAISSAKPTALFPGLPTMASPELPDYEMLTILGIFAPAGTPAPIVDRLNQEIVRLLNRPDVKEKYFGFGAEVVGSSPAQFAAKIKSEMAKWSKVLTDAGVKAN